MARRMSTTSTVIDAAVPVASIAAAWVTGKFAMRSQRISAEATASAERGSVEALAYTRATTILQGLIDSLQEEVGRWRDEANRLQQQLGAERADNDSLREQLRQAQDQAQQLSRQLTQARTQLARLPADMLRQIHENTGGAA
jgi:septal ring factor EnvC (AmiA/AmiB activator)